MSLRTIRIVNRTGTTAEWEAQDSVLLQGEIGHDVEKNEIRVGDGESRWSELEPIAGGAATPGASAYDVAVANGFAGTEAEWLASLHGQDGNDADTSTMLVSGSVVGDNLILERQDGATVDAGNVRGPAGSGGSGSSGLQSTTWYFGGTVQALVSGPALILPPYGTVELIGASLAVQTNGIGVSGLTTVRFTAGGTPVGTITLGGTSLATSGWYRTSPTVSQRIFADMTGSELGPESVIRAEVTGVPAGTTLPTGLSVTLWWRWSEA